MKYLGLDLGTKTLGLAITDALGIIASPYKVIRYDNIESLIDELLIIIKNENVNELVLGLPKNMNNSLGFAAERSLSFKSELEKQGYLIPKSVVPTKEVVAFFDIDIPYLESRVSSKKLIKNM